MDKEQKQTWKWLPEQMPGVAKLVAEKRNLLGKAWVDECWQRGVVQAEPGWFFAGEGGLMVGALWEDAEVLAFASAKVTRTQALLVIKTPQAEPAAG